MEVGLSPLFVEYEQWGFIFSAPVIVFERWQGWNTTRILGIDPGIARMGYGVIEVQGNRYLPLCYGCIETPSGMSVSVRLQMIYREVLEIIDQHQPQIMSVEQLFFNRNTTTAFIVGQARGVAILAGANANMECVEYTPMQVKLAVVGYGKAEKAQVQEMVRVLLNLSERPKPDDTADALAVALTHAHTAPLRTAVQLGLSADSAKRRTRC